MDKQKNDVNTIRRNRRWATIVIMLLLIIAIARWVESSSRSTVDRQALLQYMVLPEYEQVGQPFCIVINSVGDTTTPIGIYSPSDLVQWSEIYVNSKKVSRDQLDIRLPSTPPLYIHFCFPNGLSDGANHMELRLKDSAPDTIASFRWALDVSWELSSQQAIQDKIDALIVFPQKLPTDMSIPTSEAHAYEEICIDLDYSGMFNFDVLVNEVGIASNKYSLRSPRIGKQGIRYCLIEGLEPGRYLMRLDLRPSQYSKVRKEVSYRWVLTVRP